MSDEMKRSWARFIERKPDIAESAMVEVLRAIYYAGFADATWYIDKLVYSMGKRNGEEIIKLTSGGERK
jgi:hypothetical protein